MREAVLKILSVNLGVKKHERVLVFTDLARGDEDALESERQRREATRGLAKLLAAAGGALCRTSYIEFPSVGTHGAEPPPEVWEAAFGRAVMETLDKSGVLGRVLEKKAAPDDLIKCETTVKENAADAVQCIVALSNFSTSHTKFRDLMTRSAGARYASMPLFEESMLTGAMDVDWKAMEKRTIEVAARLNAGEAVFIKTPNNTSISFSIKGRTVEADTGILTEAGSFGNLPAGEAFVAPVEGTAEGRLVLDWAPTRRLASPVTLEVREGRVVDVVSIKGGGEEEFARALKEKIEGNPLIGNLAELGVGTNERASRPDNILEGEKILGTVHMALGDNSTFGGVVSVPFHQDFIFFDPTLEVAGGSGRRAILRDGKLA